MSKHFSGLNDWIGDGLSRLTDLSQFWVLLIMMLIALCVTQVSSNVASANILLPIMAPLCCNGEINPLYLMLPPTLVTSFSFMLPVSTPPNAIAFEPSGMTTMEMMKVGSVMNVACFVITILGGNQV